MRAIVACVLLVSSFSLKAQPVDKKELNILFIGTAGAGKSMVINVLYNHIIEKTFDELPRNFVIPLCHNGQLYPVTATDYPPYRVSACENHYERTGKVHKYVAVGENYTVNLWDTPGFMDTEGSVKDRDNTDEIVLALAGVSMNAIVVVTSVDDFDSMNFGVKASIMYIQRMFTSSTSENLIGIFNRAITIKREDRKTLESQFRNFFELSSASKVYFLDGSTFFDAPGDEDDVANRRNWNADALTITKFLEDVAHKSLVSGDL